MHLHSTPIRPPAQPMGIGPYRLGNVHEVTLRDGSSHRLVQLHDHGAPSAYLRALPRPGSARLQVIDLRRIARNLTSDLAGAPARDVPGLVLYSLRAVYPTSLALERAVAELCELDAEPHPLPAEPDPDELQAVQP